MIFLLAIFVVCCAAQQQLHDDGYYFFFADRLNSTEFQTLLEKFEEKYVVVTENANMKEKKEKVRQLVNEQIKIIRITRRLLPDAFGRLVAEADKLEMENNPPPDVIPTGVAPAPPENWPTGIADGVPSDISGPPPGYRKRKLLALDDDAHTDSEAEEDGREEAKAITRGGNGNHKHCESGREVSQLLIDKIPDLSVVHPDLSVHIDEEDASIHFSVTVPYIPYDGRYIISFDPIEHAAEIPLECSSNYDDSTDVDRNETESSRYNIWGHAPNANYRNAFTSKKDYAAYYSAPSSKWIAQASGCSHVKYGATFTIDELTRCADADDRFAVGVSQLATTEKSSAVSLVGMIWISYLQPSEHHDSLKNAVVVAKWSHPFSITVDERDSKIILVDSANGGVRSVIKHTPTTAANNQGSTERPRAVTVMRKASLIQDGRLELNLQTQFPTSEAECVPKTLKMASILWKEFEIAESPQHDSRGAYCTKQNGEEKSVILQDWRIRSKQPLNVYDGDFLLLFCELDDETDQECDESNAAHRTNLSVRMSIEDPKTEEKIEFHSEITQHVSVGEDETKSHTGSYNSGDRACMQSYVIGPKDLTSQIEVKLVEAWLCTSDDESAKAIVDEKSAHKDTLSCSGRPHAIRLVGTNQNTSELLLNAALNVSVHHPGAYGLLSVGVCFNVDARFTDSTNRSIVERRQRYESKVKMLPATIRRTGAVHIKPMFALLESLVVDSNREYDPSIEALSIHAEDQSLQNVPFVAAALRNTIDSARASGLAIETHAHEFNVMPTDIDDPIVSDFDSAVGIAVVFCVIAALALLLYFCVVGQRGLLRRAIVY